MLKDCIFLQPVLKALDKYNFSEQINYCIENGMTNVTEIRNYIFEQCDENDELEELFDEFDGYDLSRYFEEAYGVRFAEIIYYDVWNSKQRAVKDNDYI